MNGAYSGLTSTIRNLLIAGSSAMLLAGCLGGGSGGGGGGDDTDSSPTFDGNTSAASVESKEDAADVAYAATEATYQAINSETTNIPTGAIIRSSDVEDELTRKLLRLIEENDDLSTMPSAAQTLVEGTCGGKVVSDSDTSGSTTDGETTATYTYDNFCVTTENGQAVTDGTGTFKATYENDQLTSYSMTWNLSYVLKNDNGETITSSLNGTTSCDFSGSTFSCDYTEDFAGPNGETYRVENVSFSQDSNTGNFGGSARVYDSDQGYVEFTASDIDRQTCDNGNFAGGSISISDESGNTVEVSFPDCSQCVVTYNGTSTETYPQPDRN